MTKNPYGLALGYFFSSQRNRRWQKEYPLYKKGIVQEIIDENYMKVFIYGDRVRTCVTRYMTCDTAAFAEGDEVVVFYMNGDFNSPVVVGFWNNPIPCVGIRPISIFNWRYTAPGLNTYSIYVTNIEFSPDGSRWESWIGPDYWDIVTDFQNNPGEGVGTRRPVWNEAEQRYESISQSFAESMFLRLKAERVNQFQNFTYARATYNLDFIIPSYTVDVRRWSLFYDSRQSIFDERDYFGVTGTNLFDETNYLSGDIVNYTWPDI